MTGIYVGELAGGAQFADNLQSTKERLKRNMEKIAEELGNTSDYPESGSVDKLSGDLQLEMENLRREINAADFQVSKIQVAEQALEYMGSKLARLKELSLSAIDLDENATEQRQLIEKEAQELVDSFNATIDSTLFAGHELLNGAEGSVVTVDRIEGINLTYDSAADDSLRIVEQKAEKIEQLRNELEDLRTNRLQNEIATLQVTLQNAAALHATQKDIATVLEDPELLNSHLSLSAGEALSAQGNLSSSRVIDLIK